MLRFASPAIVERQASPETPQVLKAVDQPADFKSVTQSLEVDAHRSLIAIWDYAAKRRHSRSVCYALQYFDGKRLYVNITSVRLELVERILRRLGIEDVPAVLAVWRERDLAVWHTTCGGELTGSVGITGGSVFAALDWLERNGTRD